MPGELGATLGGSGIYRTLAIPVCPESKFGGSIAIEKEPTRGGHCSGRRIDKAQAPSNRGVIGRHDTYFPPLFGK